jgi:hypothetical protein
LSGAERYIGIDAVAHVRPANECSGLPRAGRALPRSRSPAAAGFPSIDEYLDAGLFPSMILDEAQLAVALYPKRLERIERDLARLGSADADAMLRYRPGAQASRWNRARWTSSSRTSW